MSLENSELLREDALSALPRTQLQKLGKLHNIKANLKSAVIIAELLQKFPDGVPSLQPLPKNGSKKALPRKPASKTKRANRLAKIDDVSDSDAAHSTASKNMTPASGSRQEPAGSSFFKEKLVGRSNSRESSLVAASVQRPNNPQSTSNDKHSQVPVRISPLKSALVAGRPSAAPAQHPVEVPDHPPQEELPESSQEPPAPATNSDYAATEIDPKAVESEQNSEQGHNTPSTSARSTPEPPASDATVEYAVQVIRATSDSDEAFRKRVDNLRDEIGDLRTQTIHLSSVLKREREMRDRIMAFLIYHIRNNNRWGTGRSAHEEQEITEQVREEYQKNGGKGWKDMGEFTYEEIWGGAPICLAGDEEVAASNEDEVLRLFDDEAAVEQLLAGRQSDRLSPFEDENESTTSSASCTTTTNKKRALSEISEGVCRSDDSLGHDDGVDKERYAPRRRLDTAQADIDEVPEAPSTSIDKGKRKMTAAELQQMELEQQGQTHAQRALDAEAMAECDRLTRAHAETLQNHWAAMEGPSDKDVRIFRNMFLASVKVAKTELDNGNLKDPAKAEEVRMILLQGLEKNRLHPSMDVAHVVSLPLAGVVEYVLASLPPEVIESSTF